MALDPNIILRGVQGFQQPDLGAAAQQGLATVGIFQKMRNEQELAPLRKSILEGQAAGQALANKKNEQALALQKENRDLVNLYSFYQRNKGRFKRGEYEAIAQDADAVAQQRLDEGQSEADISDTRMIADVMRSQDSKAIANLFKDGAALGDLLERRGLLEEDPAKVAAAEERFSPTSTTLPDGTTVQLTSTGRKVVTDAAGKLLTGSAAIEAIKKAEEFGARTQGRRAGLRVREQELEEQRQEYVRTGLKARRLMKDTSRLLELNNLISTGKTAKARKLFGDFFGVTDPNLGEFNAKAGQLILSQIKLLGANPTEGERAFLADISPSLEQGGAVNEALLKDLLKIQQRLVNRAKWFSKNPDKTIEDYLLMSDEEDFEPTSALEPTVGGAPRQDVSVQPNVLKWNLETGRFE